MRLVICSAALSLSVANAASADTSSIFDLVSVPGGTYERGSAGGESDERNVQSVTVSAFLIGQTEVTIGHWNHVTGASRSGDPVLPVTDVAWIDVIQFSNAVSELAGLKPVYTITDAGVVADWSADGFRLPTEAEWELAARGGPEGGAFLYAGSDDLGEVGWYDGNAMALQPVGLKMPNALGIYDMSGNVWEWVWDNYAPYPATRQIDPTGPERGDRRVSRGGSIEYDPARARVTNRSAELRHAPSPSAGDLGFRLARNAPSQGG